MNKASKRFRQVLKQLPTMIGYQDSKISQQIQLLFRYQYLLVKPNFYSKFNLCIVPQRILIDTYKSFHKIPNRHAMLNKLSRVLPSGSVINQVAYNSSHYGHPLIQPTIEKQIKILNHLDSVSSLGCFQMMFGIFVKQPKDKRDKIKKLDPHDELVVTTYHHSIWSFSDSDLKLVKQDINHFINNTPIGKIHWLLAQPITSYKLSKYPQVNKSTIVKLRSHKRKISNLTLKNANQLIRIAKYLYHREDHQESNQQYNDKLVRLNYDHNFDNQFE